MIATPDSREDCVCHENVIRILHEEAQQPFVSSDRLDEVFAGDPEGMATVLSRLQMCLGSRISTDLTNTDPSVTVAELEEKIHDSLEAALDS